MRIYVLNMGCVKSYYSFRYLGGQYKTLEYCARDSRFRSIYEDGTKRCENVDKEKMKRKDMIAIN